MAGSNKRALDSKSVATLGSDAAVSILSPLFESISRLTGSRPDTLSSPPKSENTLGERLASRRTPSSLWARSPAVLFFKFFHSPLLPSAATIRRDAISDPCTLYSARRCVIESRMELESFLIAGW
jgi:hypothetical protein